MAGRLLIFSQRLLTALALLSLLALGGRHHFVSPAEVETIAFLQSIGAGEICGPSGLPDGTAGQPCPACVLSHSLPIPAASSDYNPLCLGQAVTALPNPLRLTGRHSARAPPARGPPSLFFL